MNTARLFRLFLLDYERTDERTVHRIMNRPERNRYKSLFEQIRVSPTLISKKRPQMFLVAFCPADLYRLYDIIKPGNHHHFLHEDKYELAAELRRIRQGNTNPVINSDARESVLLDVLLELCNDDAAEMAKFIEEQGAGHAHI